MKLILDHVAVILSGAASAWQIVPGAEVRPVPADGEVAVMVLVTWTVLLFWSRQAWRPIGRLPPDSAARVRPMLDSSETLHVRVVNVTPPQLAADGRLDIRVSAWGRTPPEILPAGKSVARPLPGRRDGPHVRQDRPQGRGGPPGRGMA